MMFKPKGSDIHVESRSREMARFLVRDHGDGAEAILEDRLARSDLSAVDRYRFALARRELRKLRRAERRKRRGHSLIEDMVRRLLGRKRRRRR